MKQPDETKKTEIPAPGASLPDGELEAVSGGDAYPGSSDECVSTPGELTNPLYNHIEVLHMEVRGEEPLLTHKRPTRRRG